MLPYETLVVSPFNMISSTVFCWGKFVAVHVLFGENLVPKVIQIWSSFSRRKKHRHFHDRVLRSLSQDSLTRQVQLHVSERMLLFCQCHRGYLWGHIPLKRAFLVNDCRRRLQTALTFRNGPTSNVFFDYALTLFTTVLNIHFFYNFYATLQHHVIDKI